MLRYVFSTFLTLFLSSRKSRIGIEDKVTRNFRVMPWHSDDLHGMYHASYLGFMDQVRWEFVERLGLVKKSRERSWYVLFGGERIFYRRTLRLFQEFTVDCEVVGWDSQWFYARHVFKSEGDVYAVGYVKTMMRAEERSIPTREVLASVGVTRVTPRLPDDVLLWVAADEKMRDLVAVDGRVPGDEVRELFKGRFAR